MKLSDKTLSLLKNFSTINQSILFKKGTKLSTISVMKNILAEATIEDELPKEVKDRYQSLRKEYLNIEKTLETQNECINKINEVLPEEQKAEKENQRRFEDNFWSWSPGCRPL